MHEPEHTKEISPRVVLDNESVEADFEQTFHCREDLGDTAAGRIFSCANNDPDVTGVRGIKFGCQGDCAATSNPLGECECEGQTVRQINRKKKPQF